MVCNILCNLLALDIFSGTFSLNNKYLSFEQREIIQKYLEEDKTFTEIGKSINKDTTTIAKEIKLHRVKHYPSSFNRGNNSCVHKATCKKLNCHSQKSCYEEYICPYLLKPPYTCNSCSKRNGCRNIKYMYDANVAHKQYLQTLSSAREGCNLSEQEICELDNLFKDLIVSKKQSINHIYINHSNEIPFSKPTFYKYVNSGIFSIKNIDLPRKVRYKIRKRKKDLDKTKTERSVKKGRTYADFLEYITNNPDASIVEMDTVEGIKGGKVFLTLLFRKSKLMLIYLLDRKTINEVNKIYDYLKQLLGSQTFSKLFEVILTDRGSEFLDPISIITDKDTGEILANLFYCDAYNSAQKGAIEKNHEFIRYVLPKGSSFDNLNQDMVNLLMSHINSYCRDSLNGHCPYEASLLFMNSDILDKLNITKIEPDNVDLSTQFFKKFF